MNKREQREKELLAIKNAYLEAYANVHGKDCADHTQVWYEFGWFYVRQVTKDSLGYVYVERPLVVRDFQLREMTERLRLLKGGIYHGVEEI